MLLLGSRLHVLGRGALEDGANCEQRAHRRRRHEALLVPSAPNHSDTVNATNDGEMDKHVDTVCMLATSKVGSHEHMKYT